MEQAYDFIAQTTDGVCVVDRTQRIVLWNDGARRMLGFRSAETIGRRCYDVLGGTDQTGCLVCRANCAATRAAGRGELVPTRTIEVVTSAGDPLEIDVTTLLLPSRWRDISMLAHLFRPAAASAIVLDDARTGWLGCVTERREQLGAAPATRHEELTPREREVLGLLSTGATTDRMMSRLGVARTTVRTHIRRVLDKLGVHSRLEAVALAQRHGHVGVGESRGDERGRLP